MGVNPDDSIIVLDEGLTQERAEQMKHLLLAAKAFPSVKIEAAEKKIVGVGYNPGETAR